MPERPPTTPPRQPPQPPAPPRPVRRVTFAKPESESTRAAGRSAVDKGGAATPRQSLTHNATLDSGYIDDTLFWHVEILMSSTGALADQGRRFCQSVAGQPKAMFSTGHMCVTLTVTFGGLGSKALTLVPTAEVMGIKVRYGSSYFDLLPQVSMCTHSTT